MEYAEFYTKQYCPECFKRLYNQFESFAEEIKVIDNNHCKRIFGSFVITDGADTHGHELSLALDYNEKTWPCHDSEIFVIHDSDVDLVKITRDDAISVRLKE